MPDAWLAELTLDESVQLLRAQSIGRIAFVVDEYPAVFPVNYRLVENKHGPWVLLRTRPGNVIDQAPLRVAFQIDGVDAYHHEGWSVLVRGTLHHLDEAAIAALREDSDPGPWLDEDRDTWLVVRPTAITGRRLHSAEPTWAFHLRAYL